LARAAAEPSSELTVLRNGQKQQITVVWST
jgi:hypothetical protein